jgi:spore coat protein U-like protein
MNGGRRGKWSTSLRRSAPALLPVAAALMAACAGVAVAGSRSGLLAVTATVVNSCVISSNDVLAFGTYDPTTANRAVGGADLAAASGGLSISCTRSASRAIALGQGRYPANGSTDAAPLRQMSAGDGALAYALYQDAGATIVWGGTASTSLAGTASGHADLIRVYGVVTRGQDVPAGMYTDVVVVTVTF